MGEPHHTRLAGVMPVYRGRGAGPQTMLRRRGRPHGLLLAGWLGLLLSLTLPLRADEHGCNDASALAAATARPVLRIVHGELHHWLEYRPAGVSDHARPLCVEFRRPALGRQPWHAVRDLLADLQGERKPLVPAPPAVLAADDPRLQFPPLPPRAGHKGVLGEDQRQRVTDTLSYPWNGIGYLVVQFPNGEVFRGSGFLAGPRTVITNAHNLYAPEFGGWALAVTFAPAQGQATAGGAVSRPFGSRVGLDWQIHPEYRLIVDADPDARSQFGYDLGVVWLAEPFQGIERFLPLAFDVDPTGIINTAGFPAEVAGEPSSQAMWFASGTVNRAASSERELLYDADSTAGSSGSPVWQFRAEGEQRRVVAVHGFGNTFVNGGPRLVSADLALFETWLTWHPPAPTSVAGGILNISTGGFVDADGMVAGFIQAGETPRQFVVMAENAGGLADPVLAVTELDGRVLAFSDDWPTHPSADDVRRLREPGGARDAALVVSLAPGAYLARMAGYRGSTGVGTISVTDLANVAGDSLTRGLLNISTDGVVMGQGLVAGFIVEGTVPRQVVVMGEDAGGLADPRVTLTTLDGMPVQANDDWRDHPSAATVASLREPNGPRAAALAVTLPPGTYLAILSGGDGDSGRGVVSVTELAVNP